MAKGKMTLQDLASLVGTTDARIGEMEEMAAKAKEGAYCPHSKFRVGAAVLMNSGAVFQGANVENSSFPVGICAERTAIAYAVAQGHRRLKMVVVSTDIKPAASPCGMCRQFMREFVGHTSTTPIVMLDGDGDRTVMMMEELLPMSFGPDALP